MTEAPAVQPTFVSYCIQRTDRPDAAYMLFWVQDSRGAHTLAMVVRPFLLAHPGSCKQCAYMYTTHSTHCIVCGCTRCREEMLSAIRGGSTRHLPISQHFQHILQTLGKFLALLVVQHHTLQKLVSQADCPEHLQHVVKAVLIIPWVMACPCMSVTIFSARAVCASQPYRTHQQHEKQCEVWLAGMRW